MGTTFPRSLGAGGCVWIHWRTIRPTFDTTFLQVLSMLARSLTAHGGLLGTALMAARYFRIHSSSIVLAPSCWLSINAFHTPGWRFGVANLILLPYPLRQSPKGISHI